jgi:hypothetical protein
MWMWMWMWMWCNSQEILIAKRFGIPNEAQILGNLTFLMMIAGWHDLALVNNIRMKYESEYDSVNLIVSHILDERQEVQFAIQWHQSRIFSDHEFSGFLNGIHNHLNL